MGGCYGGGLFARTPVVNPVSQFLDRARKDAELNDVATDEKVKEAIARGAMPAIVILAA
jgi:hypothetical protein